MENVTPMSRSGRWANVLFTDTASKYLYMLQYHKSTKSRRPVTYTFSSTDKPFTWFSWFSYLCTKNVEFLTASHSAVSNTLFIL